MTKRVFINATNVHQGGGRSLLEAILKSIDDKTEYVLLLDERMPITWDMARNVQVIRVKPTILRRLNSDRLLAKSVDPDDVVLCFGNLPPLLKLRGHTVVFVQNRYLIDDVKLNELPLRVRLRLTMERLWLSRKISNADEFLVQTPSMKGLLEARTKGRIPVHVSPFMANYDGYTRKVRLQEMNKENGFDFLYVASGEPHKNHRQLIEAWCLLAKEGTFPSLKLTLDKLKFTELSSWMEQKIEQYRLKIKNSGSVPPDQIERFYRQAGALIYPSTFESFGLPLIEARQAGLPVLASELDYVRDVLDPEQTFDPESAVSIARAVKRFLGLEDEPLPLQDASGFMRHILKGAE